MFKQSFTALLLLAVVGVGAQTPGYSGKVYLTSNLDSRKCLTASSNSNGAAVTVTRCSGSDAQKWLFSGGSVKVFDNKCLDVTGGNLSNGAKMQIWDCGSGNLNQQFYYTDDNHLAWTDHGNCLDVPGGNTANGVQMQMWKCDGNNDNQLWMWTGADSVGGGSSDSGSGTGSSVCSASTATATVTTVTTATANVNVTVTSTLPAITTTATVNNTITATETSTVTLQPVTITVTTTTTATPAPVPTYLVCPSTGLDGSAVVYAYRSLMCGYGTTDSYYPCGYDPSTGAYYYGNTAVCPSKLASSTTPFPANNLVCPSTVGGVADDHTGEQEYMYDNGIAVPAIVCSYSGNYCQYKNNALFSSSTGACPATLSSTTRRSLRFARDDSTTTSDSSNSTAFDAALASIGDGPIDLSEHYYLLTLN